MSRSDDELVLPNSAVRDDVAPLGDVASAGEVAPSHGKVSSGVSVGDSVRVSGAIQTTGATQPTGAARAVQTSLNGIIVVDKPAGLTSQAVVSRVKRALGVRKVGHAGTLDPMATGALVVGVGRATRLLGFLAGHDKRYLATIRLGVATTTDDAEGEWVGSPVDACGLSEAQVRAAMLPLTGEISQVPSAVSAIKVDGKRAYALVRAGEQVELKARSVTVSKFELLDMRLAGFAPATELGKPNSRIVPAIHPVSSSCAQSQDLPVSDSVPTELVHLTGSFFDLDVAVECSSGTYIRALARDLGASLGVGGHLTSLRRTRVGAFDVESACLLADVTLVGVIPMGVAAKGSFAWVQVDEQAAQEVRYGRKINACLTDDPTALLDARGDLLALYQPGDPRQPGDPAKPVAVFVA